MLGHGAAAPAVRAGALSDGVTTEGRSNSVCLWLPEVSLPLEAVGSFTSWFPWLVCVCCGRVAGWQGGVACLSPCAAACEGIRCLVLRSGSLPVFAAYAWVFARLGLWEVC